MRHVNVDIALQIVSIYPQPLAECKPKLTVQTVNCSYMCVNISLSYMIQPRTVLIIFPLIPQTVIIAQTLSTAGQH